MDYAEVNYQTIWIKSKPVCLIAFQIMQYLDPITNGLSQIWSMTNVALIKLSHLIDHTGSVHTSSNLGTWSMTGRIYLPNESF